MSCLKNDIMLEKIHDDVLDADSKGLLENDIMDVVIETGLHADDDRDEILIRITEERFEALPDGPQ